MTRDGFIELRLKHTGAFTKDAVPANMLREMIANEVDFYIEAGMLKLDGPGNVGKLFEDELAAYLMPGDIQMFLRFMDENKIDVVRR